MIINKRETEFLIVKIQHKHDKKNVVGHNSVLNNVQFTVCVPQIKDKQLTVNCTVFITLLWLTQFLAFFMQFFNN